ncbi:hypothetical protein B0J17DRAFT_723272 [Rhizoctonia solani]|nr:hypothetical protein B0J17DRAFT_723272 [Rhizoctonia solani]
MSLFARHAANKFNGRLAAWRTSSLLKHQAQCELQKHQGILTEYGITGGGGPPSNYNIWEYVALWIAEDGHPFAIIDDHYLHKLIPREVVKLLLHCMTIVKDVSTLYRMSQKAIKTMLVDIVGIFHIALDLYQLANGHNYLGIVLFHPAMKDNTLNIERFVLECLSFSSKHMGVALANVVYQVLVKFGIKDRAIAAPFVKKRAKVEQDPRAAEEIEEDQPFFGRLLDKDKEDPDCNTESVDKDFDPNAEDKTGEDDGTNPLRSLDHDNKVDKDLTDIFVPNMVAGLCDKKEFKGALKVLYKIAWFARKLWFSPQFKHLFQEVCAKTNVPTPHNVQHNVSTCWNSTAMMIKDAVWLEVVIFAFQKFGNFPGKKRMTKDEFKAMKVLLQLLLPLTTLTEIMSRSNVPMLVDILVHYNSLNHEYIQMLEDTNLPLWAQQGANHA